MVLGATKMLETVVVQPTLPNYRVRFFELVGNNTPLLLACSELSPEGVRQAEGSAGLNIFPLRDINILGKLIWQRGVVGLALRGRISTLVINGNPRYVSSMLAILIAKIRRIRVVWWGHALSSSSGVFRSWLRMRMMYLSDRVLVYYPEEIERLPYNLRSRARGLNNSIDTTLISRIDRTLSEEEVRAFVEEQGIVGKRLLVTIGRVTPKSNLELVISSLAILVKRRVSVCLAVIGSGPALGEYQEMAAQLGVADSILWLGEMFEEPQIAIWMRAADAFVYGGAVGLSLIHAFAYGCPAVISSEYRDHNPEALLFKDGKCGAAFEKGNAESMATSILTLLSQPEQLRAISAHVRQLVEDRLGVEQMATRFVAALDGNRG